MHITIKSISGEKHQLECEETDTVKQVKEKIHDQLGHEVSLQKLISSGRILDDEQNLQSYNIKDGDVIVIMVTKPKPAARPPAPAAPVADPAPPQQVAAPPQQPMAVSNPAPQGSEPAGFFDSSASNLVTGPEFEATVNMIVEMGFEREQVVQAMRAAFNNPDRAIDYLMNGIPESARPQQAPPQAAAAQPGQPGVPGAQPGQMPAAQPGAAEAGGPLGFLANNPMFQQIKAMIQQNPQMLGPLLQQLAQTNPQLLAMINANREEFMRLLSEPTPQIDPSLIAGLGGPPGSEAAQPGAMPGGMPGGMPGAMPGRVPIHLTEAEAAAVQNLASFGFHPQDALEAYLTCDKNEEMAANLLFENYQPIGAQTEADFSMPGAEQAPSQPAAQPPASSIALDEPAVQPSSLAADPQPPQQSSLAADPEPAAQAETPAVAQDPPAPAAEQPAAVEPQEAAQEQPPAEQPAAEEPAGDAQPEANNDS